MNAVNSASGFLGIGSGPQAPGAQTGNNGAAQLNAQNDIFGSDAETSALQQYANGNLTASQAGDAAGDNAAQRTGMQNAIATGATTGSKFAADQMGQNSTQAGLFGVNGQGGQLGNTENLINQEQNQGFNLTPGDNTLYGQESGQIANQFGQQGNDAANNLASRGLSTSGAAGATFSGIQGNQNQMLANAQQSIGQQRFANTQQQIAQNQNYASQLANQYGTQLNQQYGRQLSGAQNQTQGLSTAAQDQNSANSTANQGNMAAANFNVQNTPTNMFDVAQGAFTGGAGAAGKSAGQNAGSGMFGGGSSMGAGGAASAAAA